MNGGDWLETPIARHVWDTKYRRRGESGPPDRDIEATWQRVADAAAGAEPGDTDLWRHQFHQLLRGFRFLPAGRILAGAGTGRRVTLFNCFVMGLIQDDMEHIFEALKEGALTMQAGGGVGYDFSTLRPAGSAARSSGRIASGPVSFLDIWDAMCATVFSTGARRGAMIASLRCDHPDIQSFITAKSRAGRLQHFNLSVQVSDDFMQAVQSDSDWPLVFPEPGLDGSADRGTILRQWPGQEGMVPCRIFSTVRARDLWRELTRASYESAEPGVLFTDRINQNNNLYYIEQLTTTNPCGEVPLPPYGACNLGSLNLVQFVLEPFSTNSSIDRLGLTDVTRLAVRFLDNIIDRSDFPLAAQAEQARGSRRVGLGITGLADALIMLGLDYASEAGREAAEGVMRTICHAAYRASVDLARERGAFPLFDPGPYLRSHFIRSLPGDIVQGIAEHGIRNSHLTAIAPTGTISLLAGNVSSGAEPVFAFRVNRRLLGPDGSWQRFELEDYAHRLWRASGGDESEKPSFFTTARSLAPLDHLRMQAALQRHVDSAISKTINVPADFPVSEFQEIYSQAWRLGLKGCTTYRPNPLRGEVLSPSGEARGQGHPDIHCCTPEREGD